jgi:hypothetical protein
MIDVIRLLTAFARLLEGETVVFDSSSGPIAVQLVRVPWDGAQPSSDEDAAIARAKERYL